LTQRLGELAHPTSRAASPPEVGDLSAAASHPLPLYEGHVGRIGIEVSLFSPGFLAAFPIQ